MVGAAVAEPQLERLEPQGAAEQLVAQADPEHRPRLEHGADLGDARRKRGGVARPVGEQDAVGRGGEHVLSPSVPGHDGDPRARLAQEADDRALDAVVEDDDVRPLGPLRRERLRAGRARHPAASAWPAISGAARTASRTSSTVAVPVETAARTAPPSRSRRVIARVSIPWRPTTPRSASQSAKPVRSPGAAFRPSRTITARACGPSDSDAVGLDAVVSDHRLGEGDELAREAGIGDHLLVPGHRGREHELAHGDPVGGVGPPAVDGAVLEHQECGH